MAENLTLALDKAKLAVFTNSNAAFLAVIMCALDFSWNEDIPTARTNGKILQINPDFFENLLPATRQFLLLHELWHVARGHSIRGVTKSDIKAWQIACDIVINNDLIRSGYTHIGIDPLVDMKYPEGTSEEEIYEQLLKEGYSDIGDEHLDIELITDKERIAAIELLVQAKEMAAGTSTGKYSGILEEIISRLLPPKIQWKQVLDDFVSLSEVTFSSYNKRNRRYPSICMPSQLKDESLGEISYYIDVSGSITAADIIRFNSELHSLMQQYTLEKVSIIQFDTKIVNESEITSFHFPQIIFGRGGTNLECVKEHIEKTNPEFVIIFSDLECNPMDTLRYSPKILWIIINNPDVIPPFGKYVHITK